MNFSSRDKNMFQTVFSCSGEESLRLLDYLRYLQVERVADKILGDPLFAPSGLWKKWASESFLGFSLEKILIQGGHAFSSSVEVGLAEPALNWSAKLRRAAGGVANAFRADEMRLGREPAHLRKLFGRFYPDATIYPQHTPWFSTHPNPYFRSLESHSLRAPESLPDRMLEIGGGACVNVAFHHSLNPSMQTVVVDLPETIFAGFTFLRSVIPALRLTLPHEVNGAVQSGPGVTFLMPMQADLVPDGTIDLGFNMSSFQEMEMTTVNHYLQLIARKLRPGGSLVSVNLNVSRYIPANALQNYDFRAYTKQRTQSAPFGTALVGHLEGLQMMHVEAFR